MVALILVGCRVVTSLFTAGELALLGNVQIPDRLVVLTQVGHTSLITVHTATRFASTCWDKPDTCPLYSQAMTAPQVVIEAAAAAEPAATGRCTSVKLPGAVQAHTWVALGKMCLADKALAKKCLPLFVQVSVQPQSLIPSPLSAYLQP